MAFNNASRIGLDANPPAGVTATDTDLFLKVFSGEVLTVFEETNVMMPLHRVRTISSGKSAQFPVTGVAEAFYHTPGESLFGNEYGAGNTPTYISKPKHAEKVIFIDGVLQASAFLASIDEAMNHYDVRSIYSTEIGRQLAYHADKATIRTVIAGARQVEDRFGFNAPQTPSGDSLTFHGNKIAIAKNGATGASASIQFTEILADGYTGAASLPKRTDTGFGDALIAGMFTAARLMDEKNVPQQGRYCLLSPELYYKLVVQNKDAINRDYGNDGNGSVAQGEIMSVAGIRIIKSNHIPTASESSTVLGSSLIKNKPFSGSTGYASPGSETLGIIFQSEGLGTVKLLDLAVESEYFMERMGTLLMAKYAMGHGVLREEACYELYIENQA